MDGPVAFGMLPELDAWIGLQAEAGRYRLALGTDEGVALAEADADPELLIALALAYFEELLDEAPGAPEATHADIAAAVRHAVAIAPDSSRRRLLANAVDAIDDGLGADAVASCLEAARLAGGEGEQVDPVELLMRRARELLPS